MSLGEWTDRFNKYIRALLNTERWVELRMKENIKTALQSANQALVVAVVVLLLILIFSPILIFLISKIVLTIQNFAYSLSLKTKELRKEKKKSDDLLYQMLPKSVALQLKVTKKVTAESYNSATIFFSDIVGFTAISARSTPIEVRASRELKETLGRLDYFICIFLFHFYFIFIFKHKKIAKKLIFHLIYLNQECFFICKYE